MAGGQYNLSLFVQLYWLAVVVFLTFQLTLWPGILLARGKYILQEGTKARVCIREDIQGPGSIKDGRKHVMMNFVFPLLIIIFITWQRFSTQHFLSGLCPRGRMSCIGKFRRNILSLRSTYVLLMALSCCRGAGSLLIHYSDQMTPSTHFWLWNTSAALWGEGAYLLLPWLLSAPEASGRRVVFAHFYVRKPPVDPRRPEAGTSEEVQLGTAPWLGLAIRQSGRVTGLKTPVAPPEITVVEC